MDMMMVAGVPLRRSEQVEAQLSLQGKQAPTSMQSLALKFEQESRREIATSAPSAR